LTSIYSGTVADNIRYGPQLKGKKLTDDEVYKLLSLADLDSSFYKKTSNELSVGQAQRVALARTLANEPEVMPIEMCKNSSQFPFLCIVFSCLQFFFTHLLNLLSVGQYMLFF
jgi:ABC-type histidine transport system ATPase subunit